MTRRLQTYSLGRYPFYCIIIPKDQMLNIAFNISLTVDMKN